MRGEMGMIPMPKTAKKAVNLSLDPALLEEARARGINLSMALESAVDRELRALRRAEWLERNAAAMAAYNEDVEKNGTFSDGLRSF